MAIHKATDNSFKIIFADHKLFSEFIRDFIHIDILKDINPEDIEDISERFIPLTRNNRDSDTVKRINLKGETPFFVIAVLEHESFEKYIPKFEYELVNLNNYNEEDIMRFGDALSLILLVDKVRDKKGNNMLTHLPSDYEEQLRLQIPEYLSKLLEEIEKL